MKAFLTTALACIATATPLRAADDTALHLFAFDDHAIPSALAGLAASPVAAALPAPETHVYKTVGNLTIKADVYKVTGHSGPRPVMVYMHGGSLINGRRESVEEWTPAHALHAAGVVIVSIDYRLAPESKLPAIIGDVEDAFRWVREGDTDVPFEQSVMMAAELKRHGVEHRLITVPGAEHGLKGSDPALLASLDREAAAFLREHLFADPHAGTR